MLKSRFNHVQCAQQPCRETQLIILQSGCSVQADDAAVTLPGFKWKTKSWTRVMQSSERFNTFWKENLKLGSRRGRVTWQAQSRRKQPEEDEGMRPRWKQRERMSPEAKKCLSVCVSLCVSPCVCVWPCQPSGPVCWLGDAQECVAFQFKAV